MLKTPKGIQVNFSITIPVIEPQALRFDPNPKSGAERTLLGRGGFGMVYAGHYEDQAVAIKSLHVTTSKVVKALHEEAALMFRIASPHTVKLLGICSDANETSLVMERMTGGSLFHLLQDEPQELPWPLRYRIAYEIAEGLWALHRQETVHRDLKSLNVLLDGEQHAKVTDFGFSKLRGQITSVAASSKQSLGTPAYKAPELVAADEVDSDSEEEGDSPAVKKAVPYSPYSDMYAYGVILWELATRKVPFEGVSQRKIEKRIQSGKHEKIPADCPAEFTALIKACWEMKPGERPRTDQVVAQTKALYEAAQVQEVAEAKDEFSAPWHMDKATKKAAAQLLADKKYPSRHVLLPAGVKDVETVVASYQRAPVVGYTIKAIRVMYNPLLNQSFDRALGLLDARHQNPTFTPGWRGEKGVSGAWRNTTHQILERMAAPHKDPNHPHLNLVPMWHATDSSILPSIFETGFATLGLVDAGYFGRGIYSAGEACYSYNVYGKLYEDQGKAPALLMNWVASYSAYPVIDADQCNSEMRSLEGKGNYANYDAHFIPVRPNNPKNPQEKVFYPCQPGQAHTYTELLVFDKAHCLPRYVVELQSDLLPSPEEIEEAKLKHQIEQAEQAEKQLAMQQAAEQVKKAQEAVDVDRKLAEQWQAKETLKGKHFLPAAGEEKDEQVVYASPFADPNQGKKVIASKDPVVLQFLSFVADGKQGRAEVMLQKNPHLALASGSVTDRSNRHFACISGFQYACWALDWKMWRMILRYLPALEAADQLEALEKEGTEQHGQHFSFNPLLGALDTYIKKYDAWYKAKAWDKMEAHWCQQVGGCQLLLPAHVAQEYSDPKRSFNPCPDFNEERRSESLITDVGDWYGSEYNGGKLGENFGYVRGGYGEAWGSRVRLIYLYVTLPKKDAEALRSLSKIRQLQLKQLKVDLLKHQTPAPQGRCRTS